MIDSTAAGRIWSIGLALGAIGCAGGAHGPWRLVAAVDPASPPAGPARVGYQTESAVRHLDFEGGILYYVPARDGSVAALRVAGDRGLTPVAKPRPGRTDRLRAFTIAADGRCFTVSRSDGSLWVERPGGRARRFLFPEGDPPQLTSLLLSGRTGDLWGTDTSGHRLLRWPGARPDRPPESIGVHGAEPGQFNYPIDLAEDQEGTIYVLDALNRRVERWDATGRYLGLLEGTEEAPLIRPISIALDPQGSLWVMDLGGGMLRCLRSPNGRITGRELPLPGDCTDFTFETGGGIWFACPYQGRVYREEAPALAVVGEGDRPRGDSKR